MQENAHPLIKVSDRPSEMKHTHPINPRSEMHGISIGDHAGLRRIGVHVVRIPPGKEANTYHSHTCEEEFYYIISGRGMAEIDEKETEVGPGDFLGFPAPSAPHQLRNPFGEDLVYLVGGERKDVEIARFPKLGKHVIRVGRVAETVDSDRLEPFWKGK